MNLYFPVSATERDALLCQRFDGDELFGMADQIRYDVGVQEDAIWVATEVEKASVENFREAISTDLGYESYALPRDVINRLTWREVSPADIANPS